MPLRTTIIGNYPKPADLPFGKSPRERPTQAYGEYLASKPADAEERLDRATRDAVGEQVAAGVHIPSDGEIRREHYIYYHCRHLAGFDFERLTAKAMRDGSWTAHVPTVTGPLAAGPPFLPRDWRVAQGVTDRPVKMTVPGPLTITDSTADDHYGDPARLGAALADALNSEIRALADTGCTWIQIDEPVMARRPDDAVAFGIDNLERCFHGLPQGVTRMVHVCCGYPVKADQENYPKADPGAYFTLADGLEAAAVDVVSIEDAHRPNDLALLERFRTTTVALGVIDVARTRVETAQAVAQRLGQALAHVDADRLIAAPDCGFAMLNRETVLAKLAALTTGARAVG